MNINKDKILEFLTLEEKYYGMLVGLILAALIFSVITVAVQLNPPENITKVRTYKTEIVLNDKKEILITEIYADSNDIETYKVFQQ